MVQSFQSRQINRIFMAANISKSSSLASIFHECKSLLQFKQLHAHLTIHGKHHSPSYLRPVIAFSALNPCGDIDYALTLLTHTPTPPTVFLLNTIIRGLARDRTRAYPICISIAMFRRMILLDLSPNNFTFTFLFQACVGSESVGSGSEGSGSEGSGSRSGSGVVDLGRQLHGMVVKNSIGNDVYVRNSMIQFYSVYGKMADARSVFDEKVLVDVVSWNSLMNGYVKNGEIRDAVQVFEEMPERNEVSWNSLIGGLVKFGWLEEARRVFDEMPRAKRNIVSWVVMISGYARNGLPMEALELFREMQLLGVEVNSAVLVSVLSACTQLGSLLIGNWIYSYILKNSVYIDSILSAGLIDMFSKCGSIDMAMQVFESSLQKNVSTYTTMISGLALNGRSEESLSLFEEMISEGIHPDQVSYMAVLSACSHKGWVEKGLGYFNSMVNLHGIQPELDHYACIVDLLGLAGLLEEAERFISTMPMEPDNVIWGSLLNACRIHGNVKLGERVGSLLVECDPSHDGRYVLLSHIYAESKNRHYAEEIQRTMRRRKIKRIPGFSSIELNGALHEFVAGDTSHDKTNEIYIAWEELSKEIREHGYKPETEGVVFDVEEEEKETVVGYHSEKLAISFGILNTEPGSTLRIVKNIRICRDCHSAIKLVSMVLKRKIVVRDRKRFHHFEGGSCSCMDYW